MEKLGEGTFNKAFKLEMDDGRVIVARIPNPNAGPSYCTTASEVATMDFLRTVLDVPVPKVFAWSATMDNPVESEYIIMEYAPGISLDGAWRTMELGSKMAVIGDIVSMQKKLLTVSFSWYGNLYYKKDVLQHSKPAELVGDVSAYIKEDVLARFCIGPVVKNTFWQNERSSMDIDSGPWRTAQEYASAIAHLEIAWIKAYAKPRLPDDPLYVSESQNSPSEHISLFEKYLAVVPYLLSTDQDVLAPTLWHTDLRQNNIFVQNGRISCIIDWQGVWAGPLLLQARYPQFVKYNGEFNLHLPENFKELDREEKANVEDQVLKSILLHCYNLDTNKENPLLYKVLTSEHFDTRKMPFIFAPDTWNDEIVPFRESLLRVEKHWKAMGFQTPCPIRFSGAERSIHLGGVDSWNKLQDYWDYVSVVMDKDGWAWRDTYEDAAAVYKIMQDPRDDAMDQITAILSKYYVGKPDEEETPPLEEEDIPLSEEDGKPLQDREGNHRHGGI